MKIVILEHDKLPAQTLVDAIITTQTGAEIISILQTVKAAIHFFEQKPDVDLIFSNTQLGKASSFDIFSNVKIAVPVIFYSLGANHVSAITAPSEKVNPFNNYIQEILQTAFDKYNLLNQKWQPTAAALELMPQLTENKKPEDKNALLVYHKDKIIPVAFNDIAFFFLKEGVSNLTTFKTETYPLSKTLEELESMGGSTFFRINRQYIVNRKAVKSAASHTMRRLSVFLDVPSQEKLVVSREKVADFLNWLTII